MKNKIYKVNFNIYTLELSDLYVIITFKIKNFLFAYDTTAGKGSLFYFRFTNARVHIKSILECFTKCELRAILDFVLTKKFIKTYIVSGRKFLLI